MTDGEVALITGITGQDGAYLAELLLSKGYNVHGIKRRSSTFNTQRIDHICEYGKASHKKHKLFLHYGDVTDATNLIHLVQKIQPDEIYNLAAQSHVQVSFETPEYTANVDALGALRLLEAIRILGMEKRCKFYQASPPSCTERPKRYPKTKTRPFIPAAHIQPPSYMLTGLSETTVKPTGYLRPMEFFSIMKARQGGKLL